MKKVAIYIDKYLQLSETFIYNEIKHLKRCHPIVLTKEILNEDVFPFEDLFLYRKGNIGKILEENKIGLIHAHFGWSGISALPIARRFNLPLIVTFFGIDASRMMRYLLYRRSIMKLFKISKLILVVSEDLKRDLIDAGCDPKKVRVNHIGIDPGFFYRREREKNGLRRIIMCGRFVEKKGLEYGIRAFNEIRNRDVELVIVGDGKLRRDIENLVGALDISSLVRLSGFLSHESVREELCKSDIFLAPHVTARNGDKEGMPTTVKEAMATSLPVVGTNHGGIPELVKHGRDGFLVDERDIKGLVYYLNKLLDDPDLRFEMGKNARKIVEQKFSLKREIDELEYIYGKYIQ